MCLACLTLFSFLSGSILTPSVLWTIGVTRRAMQSTYWSKVSLEHVCAWQRDSFDWCIDDNNLTRMEWVKVLLTNSCDINLGKHVDEKYDKLCEYEQGGITYLKIPLDEMFTMSNMVIMLLQKYLKQFAQDGVAKIPNENVQIFLNRSLLWVCVLSRLMCSLKRHRDISLRGLLGARLWNSKIFIKSLQLPIKSIRIGQSVGGGTALLLLLQLQNSAVRLIRCSTP
jgi:hypothetical protein